LRTISVIGLLGVIPFVSWEYAPSQVDENPHDIQIQTSFSPALSGTLVVTGVGGYENIRLFDNANQLIQEVVSGLTDTVTMTGVAPGSGYYCEIDDRGDQWGGGHSYPYYEGPSGRHHRHLGADHNGPLPWSQPPLHRVHCRVPRQLYSLWYAGSNRLHGRKSKHCGGEILERATPAEMLGTLLEL
jgi:hypothetical protein